MWRSRRKPLSPFLSLSRFYRCGARERRFFALTFSKRKDVTRGGKCFEEVGEESGRGFRRRRRASLFFVAVSPPSLKATYLFHLHFSLSLSLSLSLSRAWDGVWPICGRWNSRSSFLLIRPTLDRKTGASVPTRIKRLPRRGGFLTAPVRKTNPALGDSTRTRQTPPKDDTRSSCCCCDVGANDVFSRNRAVKNLDSKSARADVER